MKKTTLGWISIAIALLSAVGIVFVTDYSLWFLAILLLNIAFSIVFKSYYSKEALTVCRILIGCLFIFSSFTKGVDPLGTKYKMLDYFAAYHIEWLNDLALILAMGMILAEFLVGICLLTNICPHIAVIGGVALMLIFTFTTLFDALFNLVPDCGCFGTAIKLSNWQTFYKNLVIDAVLLPLVLNFKALKTRLTWRGQILIGFLYAVLFTGFEIYNYRHLPVLDFMNWKVGKQMNQKSETEQQIFLTFRNKETGKTQEFLSPNYPWNDSVWMSQWEFVDQRVEGGSDYLGFSALDQDGEDATEMILSTEKLFMFTSHDMSKITEKEWEKIRNITETAEQEGYYVIWVTSSLPDYVAELQEKYPFVYEVYYGDELEIKTIVRYNPGLILLDEGLVVDKWSAVDFPQGEKLINLLRR